MHVSDAQERKLFIRASRLSRSGRAHMQGPGEAGEAVCSGDRPALKEQKPPWRVRGVPGKQFSPH